MMGNQNARKRWCVYCSSPSNAAHKGFCLTILEMAEPEWTAEDPEKTLKP